MYIQRERERDRWMDQDIQIKIWMEGWMNR